MRMTKKKKSPDPDLEQIRKELKRCRDDLSIAGQSTAAMYVEEAIDSIERQLGLVD